VAKGKARKSSSEIQREILGALSTHGNRGVTELAALLQLKPHVVRYNLEALLEDRQIRSALLINHHALGHRPLNVFFDLPNRKESKALAFLESSPDVWWLTRVTGPRRFEATFLVESYERHAALLGEMGELTGTHVRDPIVGIEFESRYWGVRFLVKQPKLPSPPIVHFTSAPERYTLDELDRRIILAELQLNPPNLRQLAESLKIPQTTAKYRLDRLTSQQIISNRLFFVEPNTFYMQAQIVLNLKAHGPGVTARVVQICEELQHVEGLISGVGNWDFKVIISAGSFQQILAVERTILSALARDVSKSALYLRERVIRGRVSLPKQSP
jgi:DNA-binding Lrp family transcriptional regulator